MNQTPRNLSNGDALRTILVTGVVLLALTLLFYSPTVRAAGGDGIANPLEGACADIKGCVENVVRYALGLAGVLALAAIVYGGFLYITAAGNQERIESGKNAVTYSIIGLVIIGFAYAIVNFVFQALGGGGGGGGTTVGPGGGGSSFGP